MEHDSDREYTNDVLKELEKGENSEKKIDFADAVWEDENLADAEKLNLLEMADEERLENDKELQKRIEILRDRTRE